MGCLSELGLPLDAQAGSEFKERNRDPPPSLLLSFPPLPVLVCICLNVSLLRPDVLYVVLKGITVLLRFPFVSHNLCDSAVYYVRMLERPPERGEVAFSFPRCGLDRLSLGCRG